MWRCQDFSLPVRQVFPKLPLDTNHCQWLPLCLSPGMPLGDANTADSPKLLQDIALPPCPQPYTPSPDGVGLAYPLGGTALFPWSVERRQLGTSLCAYCGSYLRRDPSAKAGRGDSGGGNAPTQVPGKLRRCALPQCPLGIPGSVLQR